MKRTLAFLFLVMASAAFAQTPAVVEKSAPKASTASVKPAASTAKPSPASVKVVPVAAAKPSASTPAKSQAVAVKASAAPTAKANTAAAAKPAASTTPSAKPAVVSAPAAPARAVAVVPAKPAAAASTVNVAAVPVKASSSKGHANAEKQAKTSAKSGQNSNAVRTASKPQTAVAVQDSKKSEEKKQASKVLNGVGRRDPFLSPVVNMGAMGSGCSSGKRCLAIDQVALRGVVKADTGMIAVVVNAMDKAYFLRENDPVFNGYVLKITGDSIVFKETFHDKLGKPLTRDVTKSISRPVA